MNRINSLYIFCEDSKSIEQDIMMYRINSLYILREKYSIIHFEELQDYFQILLAFILCHSSCLVIILEDAGHPLLCFWKCHPTAPSFPSSKCKVRIHYFHFPKTMLHCITCCTFYASSLPSSVQNCSLVQQLQHYRLYLCFQCLRFLQSDPNCLVI